MILSAVARARATGHSMGDRLTLGLMGALSHILQPVFDAFLASYPEVQLDVREVYPTDPFGPMRAGEVDVQLLWKPVEEPDLTVGPSVFSEPLYLAVASSHPLAERATVSVEDLGDNVVFDLGARVPAYWEEAMVPFRTPSGRQIRRGPAVQTFQEMLALTGAGRAVTPAQEHCRYYYARPGITYVPMPDATPCTWGFVWRSAAETDLIRAFAASSGAADAPELARIAEGPHILRR
jgi:DNA-binding transcriptional LysR family regulator